MWSELCAQCCGQGGASRTSGSAYCPVQLLPSLFGNLLAPAIAILGGMVTDGLLFCDLMCEQQRVAAGRDTHQHQCTNVHVTRVLLENSDAAWSQSERPVPPSHPK